MKPTSLAPGLSLLAATAGIVWLLYIDRTSTAAVHLVEWQRNLPVPLWTLAGGLGLLLLGRALVRIGMDSTKPRHAPGRKAVSAPTAPRVHRGDWRGEFREEAAGLNLPTGARLVLDASVTVPVHLVLEHCTEHRARRAIELMAALLLAHPLPHRAQISFQDCPRPTTPWHHIATAALGKHLPQGAFRVVRQATSLDILFHNPDPRWRS